MTAIVTVKMVMAGMTVAADVPTLLVVKVVDNKYLL